MVARRPCLRSSAPRPKRIVAESFRQIRARVSLPWLALAFVFILFIWGNSLVPGEGSGSLSLAVMEMAHGVLRAVGLPYEWLTNFIVRKTAHFTEYMVLGIVASQAFGPRRRTDQAAIVAAALMCALVPSIDETIQLFVDGRSGQITDVLLDCCGAACGIFLRTIVVRLFQHKAKR